MGEYFPGNWERQMLYADTDTFTSKMVHSRVNTVAIYVKSTEDSVTKRKRTAHAAIG
ncbi:predicted protein [Sclerotinia sclerotiorum 1980 UF-70]|uniref:Uncharacterized protein n=1 Tax=Sclerotinia sclerotiorum (strain ATCC 18683 / 1980 / Ss-1) TaxID=665079 RepID=A7EY26_SCLS1|nr:predicted protein [Sclerotinia sclerotiorum 1980 UF-70]EDN94368.1 predicted protein [Sclerotinia sclerotiorum 1980 UF-70]